MKISDNFDLRELVNPGIYNHPQVGDRCADWIHPATGETLESIKLATGDVITINDWLWNGGYVDSGLRMPVTVPEQSEFMDVMNKNISKGPDKLFEAISALFIGVGAILSTHRQGCGFDLKPKHMTAQELHSFILKNQHLFPHIVRMESIEATTGKYTSWVHIEIGSARPSGVDIVVFNP